MRAPTAHGRTRQHRVHEVRGRVADAAGVARGAHAAALTRERNEQLVAASAAADAGKAVGEDAAAEVTLEVLLHEAR